MSSSALRQSAWQILLYQSAGITACRLNRIGIGLGLGQSVADKGLDPTSADKGIRAGSMVGQFAIAHRVAFLDSGQCAMRCRPASNPPVARGVSRMVSWPWMGGGRGAPFRPHTNVTIFFWTRATTAVPEACSSPFRDRGFERIEQQPRHQTFSFRWSAMTSCSKGAPNWHEGTSGNAGKPRIGDHYGERVSSTSPPRSRSRSFMPRHQEKPNKAEARLLEMLRNSPNWIRNLGHRGRCGARRRRQERLPGLAPIRQVARGDTAARLDPPERR